MSHLENERWNRRKCDWRTSWIEDKNNGYYGLAFGQLMLVNLKLIKGSVILITTLKKAFLSSILF